MNATTSTTTTGPMTKAERFFHENAGWGYVPGKETPEEGRERGARKLARAEEWLEEQNGYEVNWMEDDDADRSFLDDEESGREDDGRVLYGCVVTLPDGRKDSLWGIDLGPEGSLSDPYCRVVKAELALGLMRE
jgi:hypothetical protein